MLIYWIVGAFWGVGVALWLLGHWDNMKHPKADYRRIYELEVELGIRDPLDANDPQQRAEMQALGVEIPLPDWTADRHTVMEYQGQNYLYMDGVLGPKTIQTIRSPAYCECGSDRIITAISAFQLVDPLIYLCERCGKTIPKHIAEHAEWMRHESQ